MPRGNALRPAASVDSAPDAAPDAEAGPPACVYRRLRVIGRVWTGFGATLSVVNIVVFVEYGFARHSAFLEGCSFIPSRWAFEFMLAVAHAASVPTALTIFGFALLLQWSWGARMGLEIARVLGAGAWPAGPALMLGINGILTFTRERVTLGGLIGIAALATLAVALPAVFRTGRRSRAAPTAPDPNEARDA